MLVEDASQKIPIKPKVIVVGSGITALDAGIKGQAFDKRETVGGESIGRANTGGHSG